MRAAAYSPQHSPEHSSGSLWGGGWYRKRELVRVGNSQRGRGGQNVSCEFGGKTYYKVPPPNPILEASESGICLVCCRFLYGDLCCMKFGGFWRGFSWRIFLGTFSPQKSGEQIRWQNLRKKSGGPKIKIREKSVLPKTDPKNSPSIFRQHETLSLPKVWALCGKEIAPGKSALPSGTLLDFLLWERHDGTDGILFREYCTMFQKRELTEFCGKLGEFCEKLGEFALARAHTHHRLKGTHWVQSLKPRSPKSYSACFWATAFLDNPYPLN